MESKIACNVIIKRSAPSLRESIEYKVITHLATFFHVGGVVKLRILLEIFFEKLVPAGLGTSFQATAGEISGGESRQFLFRFLLVVRRMHVGND